MIPSQWALDLCWAGWFKVAQRYPDQGLLGDVAWHRAVFWIDLKGFGVVASANHRGLRVALSLGPCAVFFPWLDVAISAERGWLDTVIRIQAPDFSPMTLAIEADDDIADDLLRPAGIVLAPRKCKWCPCLWVAVGLAVLLGAIIVVIALRR